jgi:hypothetical protein
MVIFRKEETRGHEGGEINIHSNANKSLPLDSRFSHEVHLNNSSNFTTNPTDIVLTLSEGKKKPMNLDPERRRIKINFLPSEDWVPSF